MIIVIDNYDSFTYNLVQYASEALQLLGSEATVQVFRNDRISVHDIESFRPSHILISPGPGTPSDAGVSMEVIRTFSHDIPILGVCLGHQCMAEVFGARVVRARELMHGKTSAIYHDCKSLFAGLESPFTATRYHSLIVDKNSVNHRFEISAWTSDGDIMGLRLRNTRLEGLQFHPESVLTAEGKTIIRNFLMPPH
jgi:anthranilate synthase/aminodeoxychorismate synthase-like glutamine amidotransferase